LPRSWKLYRTAPSKPTRLWTFGVGFDLNKDKSALAVGGETEWQSTVLRGVEERIDPAKREKRPARTNTFNPVACQTLWSIAANATPNRLPCIDCIFHDTPASWSAPVHQERDRIHEVPRDSLHAGCPEIKRPPRAKALASPHCAIDRDMPLAYLLSPLYLKLCLN
jgi:hypothetical protein